MIFLSVERPLVPLEVEFADVVDNVYSRFAVELARKIAGESGEGPILMSRTEKDLVDGAGLNVSGGRRPQV